MTDRKLPPINADILAGLACHMGATKAIEFAAFAAEHEELSDSQKKLLLRGWLAIQHMPGDASLEASDLHKCLTALRQAWITISRTKEN